MLALRRSETCSHISKIVFVKLLEMARYFFIRLFHLQSLNCFELIYVETCFFEKFQYVTGKALKSYQTVFWKKPPQITLCMFQYNIFLRYDDSKKLIWVWKFLGGSFLVVLNVFGSRQKYFVKVVFC